MGGTKRLGLHKSASQEKVNKLFIYIANCKTLQKYGTQPNEQHGVKCFLQAAGISF